MMKKNFISDISDAIFLSPKSHKIINRKCLATIMKSNVLMRLFSFYFLFPSLAKIYPGSGLSGEVEKHPGDAPDSGYIAIVTILIATLLVVVLTVVS